MTTLEAIVIMGPPGSGKSFLGNWLNQQGIASYVELEPILVAKYGTGSEFAQNKPKAMEYIHQSYREQLASRSRTVAFESTGLSDRSILEDLRGLHNIALIKLTTPKSVCLQRIGTRAAGQNIDNDLVASARFYDFWYEKIEPTYTFDLEVIGQDVDQATSDIRKLIQDSSR